MYQVQFNRGDGWLDYCPPCGYTKAVATLVRVEATDTRHGGSDWTYRVVDVVGKEVDIKTWGNNGPMP